VVEPRLLFSAADIERAGAYCRPLYRGSPLRLAVEFGILAVVSKTGG
jgi:hypothetical protein